MAGSTQPTAVVRTMKSNIRTRPPPSTARSHSGVPPSRIERASAISRPESVASVSTTGAGTKRKAREFEHDDRETNINVVVRCRGRNEREVRENSGVVLHTEGVKGKSLELSMGPTALTNKTFHFDKVFSSAADQSMIYDDVVTPILDEMLAGYNCTIFAYGQTGTGKTYTMSGDMSDHYGMLSDAAGIIPRALHALFTKLEIDGAESSVKVSFIELYNEELRDLIAPNDNSKLKIYEDHSKKGQSSTFVQGIEESHIESAKDGVKILQDGSLKRQVAATKCNDLSSRSHTIFTVTVYVKRTAETGEEYISAGKLNLVDLAGSENIQRSGAENKRAAEAGLINKSLLTLGRVINALVDRSIRDVHIPYRESKLTRLLQDSLGGQTKTCIIATVSPARSNLEETISTLDYAFRAKNIRNKPQLNAMVEKRTLLTEFTREIEKLKSELTATRQRHGVYLTNDAFEEMTVQSESQRLLSEEQAAKIEAIESNLRNKVQELFSLTSNFMTLKKDNEGTKAILDETKSDLEQTEFVLAKARQCLAEESMLRKAHQHTEEQLKMVSSGLVSTLGKTVNDIDGLHAKNKRKSDLHMLNRNNWGSSQAQISDVTTLVETRVDDFKIQQQDFVAAMTDKMQSFVYDELNELSSTKRFLENKVAAFESSKTEVSGQTKSVKEEMDAVLEEIKVLRDDVKTRVGEGLQGLSLAAERISAEVINNIGAFHIQLHGSYSSLGRDFKSLFEELIKHIDAQKAEANELRQKLDAASEVAIQSNTALTMQLGNVLRVEREQAAVDRQNLLSQITDLVMKQGTAKDQRLEEKISEVRTTLDSSKDSFEMARMQHSQGMDAWNAKETELVEEVLRSREALKSKLKDDWDAAEKHTSSLQGTTSSIQNETVRIVDEQIKDIATQMQLLDDFVTRARSQNAQHHDQHTQSLQGLSNTVRASYTNIGNHFDSSYKRVKYFGDEMLETHNSSRKHLASVDDLVCQPLADLRTTMCDVSLVEYQATGQTPQKVSYVYQTELPQTGEHEVLLAALRGEINVTLPSKPSPTVFLDEHDNSGGEVTWAMNQTSPVISRPATAGGLREIDANVNAGNSISSDGNFSASNNSATNLSLLSLVPPIPKFKRSMPPPNGRLPVSKSGKEGVVHVTAEGRENVPPSAFGHSTGRRRSPRIGQEGGTRGT